VNYQEQITTSFLDELEKISEYKEAGLPSELRRNAHKYVDMADRVSAHESGRHAGSLMAKAKKLKMKDTEHRGRFKDVSTAFSRDAERWKDIGRFDRKMSRANLPPETASPPGLLERLMQHKTQKGKTPGSSKSDSKGYGKKALIGLGVAALGGGGHQLSKKDKASK
jgi:hypothetical protein